MALEQRIDRDPATSGTPCSVGRALAKLPADDLEVFERLLGTPERRGKDAGVIFGIMQDERRDILRQASAANEAGNRQEAARLQDMAEVFDVKYQTINRHRGGKCRCVKDAA